MVHLALGKGKYVVRKNVVFCSPHRAWLPLPELPESACTVFTCTGPVFTYVYTFIMQKNANTIFTPKSADTPCVYVVNNKPDQV